MRVETFVGTLLGLSAILTVACWVSLWRGRDGLVSKLVWTCVSAFPLLGPLLYAGVHDPPPVQPEVDRASLSAGWDTPPPEHVPPPDHSS